MSTAALPVQLYKRLSQLAVASVAANALTVCAVLLLAKRMGPDAFGRYYLVVTLVNLAVIPIVNGIGASLVRQIAAEPESTPEALGAAAIAAVLLLGTIALVCLTPGAIALVLGEQATGNLNRWAFAVALLSVPWVLFEALLRGQRRIAALSLMKVGGSLLNLGVAVSIAATMSTAAESPLLTRLAEMSVLLVATPLVASLRVALSRSAVRRFSHFALPVVVSGIGMGTFANIDKLLFSRVLDPESLGRYSLAFYLTYTMVSKGAEVTLAVLFPEAVAYTSKPEIARRLLAICPRLGAGIPIGLFAASYVLSRFLQTSFALDWRYLAWFSLGATLFYISHLYWWLLSADGVLGARLFSVSALLSAAVTIGAGLALVPSNGAAGAIAGLLAGTATLFGLGWVGVHRMASGKSYA